MKRTRTLYKVNRNKRGSAAKGFLRPTVKEFFGMSYNYDPKEVPENVVRTMKPENDYVLDLNGDFVVIRY